MKPNVSSNAIFKSNATVVVVDPKPLSLLTIAGVLHHSGMRCVCARTYEAAMKACGVETNELRGQEDQVGRIAAEVAEIAEAAQAALRVDEGESGVPEKYITPVGLNNRIDLLIWDVGDDPAGALKTLQWIRETLPELPAVLLAESRWAGLEKKTELLPTPTRCLFKPIDTLSLIDVAEPLLWMPALQTAHRRRGSRPSRPGWVTL